jgi:hypothetical protein
MEWLLDLEKYSKIKDYTLTQEDAEKIWDTVGGGMWEIQHLLGQLFDKPLDEVDHMLRQMVRNNILYFALKLVKIRIADDPGTCVMILDFYVILCR